LDRFWPKRNRAIRVWKEKTITITGAVKTYEIRVLPGHRAGPEIYSSSHMDDHAAIRRAIALAKPGQVIEVWCGARCIYAGLPSEVVVH